MDEALLQATAVAIVRRMGFASTETTSVREALRVEGDGDDRCLVLTLPSGRVTGPPFSSNEPDHTDADYFAEVVEADLKERQGRFGETLPWRLSTER